MLVPRVQSGKAEGEQSGSGGRGGLARRPVAVHDHVWRVGEGGAMRMASGHG